MSAAARERTLKTISKRARRNSLLPSIDQEYNFYEIATITRAGQAKALGLNQKGHLGLGADADVAVYNMNPKTIDPAKEYKTIIRAFSKAAYTLKEGEIVARDGEIVRPVQGGTFWVDIKLSSPMESSEDLKWEFREYWTVEYENYPIPEDYLKSSVPITVKARI